MGVNVFKGRACPATSCVDGGVANATPTTARKLEDENLGL